jgi:undecaprenyl diphosphate synthase
MTRSSSTQDIPEAALIPNHVAIIMDGNGRWATSRYLPRVAGHAKGVESVRGIVKACVSSARSAACTLTAYGCALSAT